MCFMSMQVAIIAEIYKTCVLFLNMYSDLLSQLSINNELNYVHYYSFQKHRMNSRFQHILMLQSTLIFEASPRKSMEIVLSILCWFQLIK